MTKTFAPGCIEAASRCGLRDLWKIVRTALFVRTKTSRAKFITIEPENSILQVVVGKLPAVFELFGWLWILSPMLEPIFPPPFVLQHESKMRVNSDYLFQLWRWRAHR